MEEQINVPLTASEMSNLWASYNNDTLSKCVLKYFVATNGDVDIRAILDYALQLCEQHIQTVTGIFTKEKFPIPVGFDDDDVNLQAPRLYTDAFYLDYLKNMGKVGLATYGLALATSARLDIRNYYQQCSTEAAILFQMASEALLSKGLFVRAPLISIPQKPEFITKKTFYGGLLQRDPRPLTSVEISHVFHNIETNVTGHTLLVLGSSYGHSESGM